jgi:hypothetical protein
MDRIAVQEGTNAAGGVDSAMSAPARNNWTGQGGMESAGENSGAQGARWSGPARESTGLHGPAIRKTSLEGELQSESPALRDNCTIDGATGAAARSGGFARRTARLSATARVAGRAGKEEP